MNNFTRKVKYANGSVDTIMISSDDNYVVNLSKNYKLYGYNENKVNNKFKNSMLGMDIGFNNSGFISMTVIAGLIAVLAFVGMLFCFRI